MFEARCSALLAALSILITAGCSDLFLVELGRGQIGQVLVDRTFPTGHRPYEGCPEVRLAFESDGGGPHGNVVIAPLSHGCLLSVRVEDAILLNAATMSAWSDALASYDMRALVAIDVIIDELRLLGEARQPLDVRTLAAVSIALDDRILVDHRDLAHFGKEELRVSIPQSLIDRFIEALDEKKAFTGTIDVRLVLRPEVAIPRALRVRTLLQPVLLVDGWRATF